MSELRFSNLINNYPASGIRKMFDIAEQYDDVIKLTVGEPNFDTPDYVKDAAKKTKVVKHSAIRFMSSNTKIATVSKRGVVKGIKKGKATIYAYAQNGIYRAIKITVK